MGDGTLGGPSKAPVVTLSIARDALGHYSIAGRREDGNKVSWGGVSRQNAITALAKLAGELK